MAVMSSLKNLPAGFRLNPRDEDLINFFLLRKLQNIPDPDGNCLIPELDIYKHDPRDLIAVFEERASINSNGLECFFFNELYKDPKRKCNKRKIAGGKGFWHQTGEGRLPQPTDKLPWAKRIFCHRLGTQRNSKQTDWVMHEFRLISDERFVLCRITKKPKKKFSASAGKKRKPVGSTDDTESHQETSPESCVLNDIITKKAKNHTALSQNDNQSPHAAGSEASVHINAAEFPSTPLSDIITLHDLDGPLSMDELLAPFSDIDIISPYYMSEMSPASVNMMGLPTSVNMMGIQTPPLDISVSDYSVDTLELAG